MSLLLLIPFLTCEGYPPRACEGGGKREKEKKKKRKKKKKRVKTTTTVKYLLLLLNGTEEEVKFVVWLCDIYIYCGGDRKWRDRERIVRCERGVRSTSMDHRERDHGKRGRDE